MSIGPTYSEKASGTEKVNRAQTGEGDMKGGGKTVTIPEKTCPHGAPYVEWSFLPQCPECQKRILLPRAKGDLKKEDLPGDAEIVAGHHKKYVDLATQLIDAASKKINFRMHLLAAQNLRTAAEHLERADILQAVLEDLGELEKKRLEAR